MVFSEFRRPATYRAKVQERHVSGTGRPELETTMMNLGDSGFFVGMDDPPPKGTILEIEFVLPGRREAVRVLGLVKWRERLGPLAGAGVKLSPIGKEERSRFAGLVGGEEPDGQ